MSDPEINPNVMTFEDLKNLFMTSTRLSRQLLVESKERNKAICEKLLAASTKNLSLEAELAACKGELAACKGELAACEGELAASRSQVTELHRDNARLRDERNALNEEVISLKGRIRVMVRIRPSGDDPTSVRPEFQGSNAAVMEVDGRSTKYSTDHLFPSTSSQAEVFKEIRPIVILALEGHNVCVIAYGQTGSGKTHTMQGTQNDPGVIPTALRLLLQEASERQGWVFDFETSCLEVYNETLRDLLTDEDTRLEVQMTGTEGVAVPGLTWKKTTSVDDIEEVLAEAQRRRATSATAMNATSSRSHLLLSVRVHGSNEASGAHLKSKVVLVDLAGRNNVEQSGVEGVAFTEATQINQSLTSLSRVIECLQSNMQHVPFRDSILTSLLKDSLIGSSKTIMIVHVAEAAMYASETASSLLFAQASRRVTKRMVATCMPAVTVARRGVLRGRPTPALGRGPRPSGSTPALTRAPRPAGRTRVVSPRPRAMPPTLALSHAQRYAPYTTQMRRRGAPSSSAATNV